MTFFGGRKTEENDFEDTGAKVLLPQKPADNLWESVLNHNNIALARREIGTASRKMRLK
jgi:hypothetical protein